MIFNKSEYNPFPTIKLKASEIGRSNYDKTFYDFVRKELFIGGVVPETEKEAEDILVLLLNMDII